MKVLRIVGRSFIQSVVDRRGARQRPGGTSRAEGQRPAPPAPPSARWPRRGCPEAATGIATSTEGGQDSMRDAHASDGAGSGGGGGGAERHPRARRQRRCVPTLAAGVVTGDASVPLSPESSAAKSAHITRRVARGPSPAAMAFGTVSRGATRAAAPGGQVPSPSQRWTRRRTWPHAAAAPSRTPSRAGPGTPPQGLPACRPPSSCDPPSAPSCPSSTLTR